MPTCWGERRSGLKKHKTGWQNGVKDSGKPRQSQAGAGRIRSRHRREEGTAAAELVQGDSSDPRSPLAESNTKIASDSPSVAVEQRFGWCKGKKKMPIR